MDTPIISKPEEDSSEENKKIEFAQKLGEDLNKKDPKPSFLNEKKVEDIYDVKSIEDIKIPGEDEDKEANEKVDEKIGEGDEDSLPQAEILEEKPSAMNMSVSDLFEKIKNKFSKTKQSEDGVLEVNLVKEEIVKYFDWQNGVLITLLAIFISLALLSVGYWGISWWAEKKQVADNSAYTQNYFKVNKEIKELTPQVEQVLAFKNRLDLSNALLDGHIYWTNFFDFLENNTLANVYFSSFSGDISGEYSFGATSNNVDAINAQIKKLLDNPYIKDAKVDSTDIKTNTEGSPSVSFQLVFSVDPQIFLKKEDKKSKN